MKDHFSTQEISKNLGKLTANSTLITLISQGIQVSIYFIGMLILARLLKPTDFGITYMVNSILGLLLIFNDLGLSMGSVQKEHITHEQVSFLFWLNFILSLIVCLIGVLIAPFLAEFYHNQAIFGVTIALSLGFIPNGLVAQHKAILKRKMAFFKLALADIISISSGIITGIIAAKAGMGYWSIVYMQLSRPIVYMFCIFFSIGWLPGKPKLVKGIKSILTFGSYLSMFNFVNFLLRNTDNILIGRVWGGTTLGYYGKAYELLMLPIQNITAPLANVFVPALSRLQSSRPDFSKYYNIFLSSLFLLTLPVVMVCIVHAQELIDIILGKQWHDSGRIFYYLSFGGIAQVVCTTSGWLYVSLGRSRELFLYGSIGVALFICSFFIGLPYGANGVATAYSIAMNVWMFPCMFFATRNTPISLRLIFNELSVHILGMLFGGALSFLTRQSINTIYVPFFDLLTSIIIGLMGYFIIVIYLFGRWKIIKIILTMLTKKEQVKVC